MATKKCSKCKEDVHDDAKKCKHCGSDLRNWFVRHKILTVILTLLVIGIISSKNGGKTPNTNPPSSDSSNSVVEESKKVTKANCDQIKVGMTGEQVKSILGEPKSTSESEIEGIGKSEYWHYQDGFSMQACGVMLSNGKVSSKTWTDL